MAIVDLRTIARTVGFGENPDLEFPLQPRGFRLLAGIPSIPNAISERLVERFGSLQALMAASLEDLRAVDGVGEARARTVREQLSRMAESSLEKYL
jgi:DNA integrity scanning protein disA